METVSVCTSNTHFSQDHKEIFEHFGKTLSFSMLDEKNDNAVGKM